MSVDLIRFLIFAGILIGLVVVALAIPAFRPYLRKNPAVAFLLGISSGFPFTLIAATMTFWLAKVGFTPTTIGFAVMVGIPYTVKFLWAPLVDKIPLPFLTKALGQRRSWLFFAQFFLVMSIWQMGASDPRPDDYSAFLFWAVITAFFSATQDIVIDAYRIEILEEEEFAHGTATNQFGYRTGNLIAGAGTIYFASQEGLGLGWATAYALTTLCVVPAIIGALWAGEGKFVDRFSQAAGMKPGQWLTETVVNPFREFLTRNGALMILLFILVYKIGDAMGQAMLGPMIVDLGFADLDYITANKIWGFAALIIGSALGAPFVLWLGMGRALLISVLLMMFSNLMFMALSIAGNNYWMLVAAIVTENITSGIGLTVVAVYLSGLSNIAYTATQFALLSSFAVVGRTFMAGPAGFAAEKLGWTGFWGLTVVAAIPGMILLWMMWRRGYVVQSIRQTIGIDEGKLREPVGAVRIAGFALIVAGLVGVLMAQQLDLGTTVMIAAITAFGVGALLAWKGNALKAAPGS
ncbi:MULTISPECIES: AmpG family muropeptide MFS transporter [unclassified Sphingopyxis]|uniref:AmpG family muropeptide MFS transporter n=1 Tax=unclassified Sphingopyxis TaxID=2614943 RepID=UPI00285F58E8|nr:MULTISPECIES: MFS transporter [unclassified Sphingopyxis]MDR6831969.1 PAT family beta-lactamase induction signal transducer AmpG [Sphingopyxis sp. BE122]MDR7227711.1 PAT family beta-lactamase induction signal transducer AmpG [Sphingopyxis sp. BE259]